MVLSSIAFSIFFIILSLTYFILPFKYRWVLLLLGSYYFYMYDRPKYIIIIILSTFISYLCGLAMDKKELNRYKKIVLIFSIVINIGLLFLFKYLNLVLDSAGHILGNTNFHRSGWIIPLGISFYTLQTLSYLIDIYRGNIKAEKHLGYYALYVSFFLTILSGPIERGSHLIPQLHKKSNFNYNRVTDGMKLILWGLFKKIVIADGLSGYVNLVYNNVYNYVGWSLLFATFFFSFQLYFDFSGYTDIVTGCAKILGFDLIPNFNFPYFSKSIQEFWKRWHISLSSWFRDYLYIPLGGNKVNRIRWYFNLFIVFLVSGIWHGANWTFAIWGALHGFYQILGKATHKYRLIILEKLKINLSCKFIKFCSIITTFCLVNFAWIFFRANSIHDASYIIRNLFCNLINFNPVIPDKIILFCLALLIFTEINDYKKSETFINRLKNKPILYRWLIYYCLIFSIIIFGNTTNTSFIYKMF